VGVARRRC